MSNPNIAEVTGEGPVSLAEKLTLLPGYEPDYSAVTFCLQQEDHTLGNSLRYMIMKDPRVEFCGYSNPHPSEDKIHLRIQTYEHASALDILRDAIENLDVLFMTIGDVYDKSLTAGNFERFVEPKLDHDKLTKMAEAGKQRRAQEQVEAAEAQRQAALAASTQAM